jgi:thioredoxin 1
MKLYKFYADWCQPCKVLSKVLNAIQLGNIELVEVNIELEPELVHKYNITAVPTLMLENERKLIGLQTKEKIIEFLGV